MRSVAEVLAQLGGSATSAELVAATSRRALARAVKSGDVVRLTRGVYGHPQLSADRSTALAHGGVLSHTSAALAWRLPLLGPPPKPHVTLPTHRKARPGPAAVLHWADLPAIDLRRGLTSLERTVIDCARILPFGEALAVGDAALATGRLSAEELQTAAVRARGRGRANALAVALNADARSASFLESIVRSLLLAAGITDFEPQVLVATPGRTARVDLGNRRLRIALEAEGYEWHGSAPKFAEDCRRYDDLVAAGWLVLRFTYGQVLGDPDWVISTVRSAMAQRGAVPTDC
jgi:very-short-patch-repair endonuclease